MSKVKKITLSNLRSLAAQTADFNGCTALVTGRNNSGKTTFLSALPERLRGENPDAILKTGEKEGFTEWELTTGEKLRWEVNTTTKKGEKLIYTSEKNISSSITKEISARFFPETFDVDKFLKDGGAKQRIELQKIVGLDFKEIEGRYSLAYTTRTEKNTIAANERAKMAQVDKSLPIVEVPTVEMETELLGIDSHNEKVGGVKNKIEEKNKSISENNAEILRLEGLIVSLKEKNTLLSTEVAAGDKWLLEEKNQIKDKAVREALQDKITKQKDENKKIVANNLAIKQVEVVEKADAAAKEADEAVKKILNEKDGMIKGAKMPDGFNFSDDGITYNGHAFSKENLSSSTLYIAALKLAAMKLGEVRTLHFDASFLDKNSLLEIEVWANANDLQLLIERPDFDGGEIKYEIIELNTPEIAEKTKKDLFDKAA